MNRETRKREQQARDALLKLMSDEEISSMSTGEAGARLKEGDEYVDLEQLRLGVQLVGAGQPIKMGHVLPRSVLRGETWEKLCLRLSELGICRPP